jgi:hypothetical protein
MAAVCSQGHEVADGQNFCPECGEAVADGPSMNLEVQSLSYGALFADALFYFLAFLAFLAFVAFVALACVVMFVVALIGAGKANAPRQVRYVRLRLGVRRGALADRRGCFDRRRELARFAVAGPLTPRDLSRDV